MLFTEAPFYAFFALCFAVYWSLRSNRVRKQWLLACSYFFYGYWDWRFLLLIFASTTIDYVAARALHAAQDPGKRRAWLVVSLAANLGFLGFFKYFDFFVTSGAGLLQLLGIDVAPRTLEIILPIGISFFTFQTMSYTIDVYRRELEPTRDFADFALFVGFFPQLVAGPIVRARLFLPQLLARRSFASIDLRKCLLLFLAGYFKKAVLADNIAAGIDPVFADPAAYGAASLAIAAVGYAVQIYCDFSGYSDMAIALAGLLGYQLPKNFDFPYLSTSIAEFWRRWHMTLTGWLNAYLFTPLGRALMRRAPPAFSASAGALAQLVTMTLCGLWHGAAWTFVVWGALHGLALILGRFVQTARRGRMETAASFAGWAVTFSWTVVSLTLFRSQSFEDAGVFLQRLGSLAEAGASPLPSTWWLLLLGSAGLHLATRHLGERATGFFERLSPLTFGVSLGLATSVCLFFTPVKTSPFIYFQF